MAKRKRSLADGGHHGGSRRRAKAHARATPEPPLPPQYPYDSEKGIPITETIPDITLLEDPLSVKESFSLSHSLAQSRNKWLSGVMFTKFWTRPPRGRKLAEGEVNAREKMAKLCECLMAIGPHIFDVKLFIVKDESKDEPEKTEGGGDLETKKDQTADTTEQHSTEGAEKSEEKVDVEETANKEVSLKQEIESEPSANPSALPDTEPPNTNTQSDTISTAAEPAQISESPVPETDDTPSKSPEPVSNQPLQPTEDIPAPSATEPLNSPPPPVNEPEPMPQQSTSPDKNSNEPEVASTETSQSQTQPQDPNMSPSQDPQLQRSPTPTAASVASNPNNMATIMKLQAIARIDRSLNSLMKIVASGNATSEQITAFQAYINRARSMELEDIPRFFKPVPEPDGAGGALETTGKGKGKKKDGGPRKPGKQRGRTATKYQKKNKDGEGAKKKNPNKPKNSYIPKKLQKKVTIVFEFKDNPADRYIIPKNSVIEILPTNEVLISFLLLFPEGGVPVKPNIAQLPPGNVKIETEDLETNKTLLHNEPDAQNPNDAIEEDDGKPKCYYPLTVTLRNMPVKSLPILERSVNKTANVAEYMQETMKSRIRAKNWWVWFQIDKRDQNLLSQLVLPAKPPENMFIPARVRVYKSKKKSKEDAERKKKKKKEDGQDGEAGTKSEDDADTTLPPDPDTPQKSEVELPTVKETTEPETVPQPPISDTLNVDPSLLSKEPSPQASEKPEL